MADQPAVKTQVRKRPYTVICNGRVHHRDGSSAPYESIHTFGKQKAAYGHALDFVIHGPKTNRALVRLHDKPFLQIERAGGFVTTVKVNWSGE